MIQSISAGQLTRMQRSVSIAGAGAGLPLANHAPALILTINFIGLDWIWPFNTKQILI